MRPLMIGSTVFCAATYALFAQGKIATMRNAYWSVAKVVGDNPAMKGKIEVRE